MALAGQLEIQLIADVARLQRDMAQVKSVVNSTAQSLEHSLAGVKNAFGALGIGVSAVALVAFMRNAINVGDELNKLSQKTGIAIGELSALKHVADLSGVSTEGLAKGMKKLSEQMVEATDETTKQAKLFKTLGIDINTGPSVALEKLATQFAGMRDGAVKTALATQLFGKAGQELIPLLNQGADGIKKLKEEAQRLGLVWTEDAAKAAEQFNDNVRAIQKSSEGLATDLVNQMGPSLVAITNAMKEAAISGGVLHAVWVGLGGALAELLGIGGTSAVVARVRDIEKEIIRLSDNLPHLQAEFKAAWAKGAPSKAFEVAIERTRTQIHALQTAVRAVGGEFDDQAARMARQGRGRVAGGASERAVREALAIDDARKKLTATTKDLALADQAWLDWLKKLDDEKKAAIALDEQILKDTQALHEALGRQVQAVADAVEHEKFANKTRGMTRSAIEDVIIARMEERLGVMRTIEGAEAEVRAMELQIQKRKELRDAIGTGEQQVAMVDALRQQADMWNQIGAAAGNFFSDLVMNGQDAFKNLEKAAKDFMAELIALFAKRLILQLAANITGNGSLQIAANAVGQGSTAGSVLNYASSAYSAYRGGATAYGALFGGGMSTTNAALGLGASEVGTAAAAGAGAPATSSMPAWAGTAGWIAAIVAAMYANNELFTRGWRADNQDSTSNATGAAFNNSVDRSLRSIGFSDRIASLLSGSSMTQRIFGMGATHADAAGMRGSVGYGTIAAQGWQDFSQRGGVTRSDNRWTDPAELTAEAKKPFEDLMRSFRESFVRIGALIGQDAGELLATFTREFNLQLTADGGEEEIKKAIIDFFRSVYVDQAVILFGSLDEDISRYISGFEGTTDELIAFAEQLAGVVQAMPKLDIEGLDFAALDALALAGENIVQTFTRVADTFMATSLLADEAFGAVGMATFAAREQLVAFAGGLENFSALTQSYYENFYSEAERTARSTEALTGQFEALGLTMPESREAFRSLMEGFDLTTESGRSLYASVLALNPAFASVAAASEAAAQQLKEDWQSVEGLIDQLSGNNDRTRGGLNLSRQDATSQFGAANEWARGMTPDQLIAQLVTITKPDFQAYSSANRELIRTLLQNTVALQGLDTSVQVAAASPSSGGESELDVWVRTHVEAERVIAEAAREAAARTLLIAQTTSAMEIELLRATGREQEAVNRERTIELQGLLALSPALAQLQTNIWLAVDAAREEAARTVIRNEHTSLTLQLLRAQGNEQAALNIERDIERARLHALSPGLVALAEQLWAVQDAAVAAATAAAAQAEIIRQNVAVAAEAQDLNDRLLGMTSPETLKQIERQRELHAALSDANRSILEQIFALEDEAAARAAIAAVTAQGGDFNLREQRLLGNNEEVLRLERERELAGALNEVNRQTLLRIYALEDEAVIEQAAAVIATERQGLHDQLNQLTMTSAQLLALQRDALDESNRALFDQIQVASAAAEAEAARAARAVEVANERTGLQDELNQLTLTSTELLALQREALDASNRALFDQVQAARAAAEAIAHAAQVQQQHYGLETQLLQLQGNTVELRARELALLDPANRAIQLQIWALQDLQVAEAASAQAAQAAATAQQQAADAQMRAADQLAGAWLSATRSIMDEVNRIRGLMGTTSQSLAMAQAQFATSTAQARAGDIAAANLLPGLSQSILEMAMETATSSRDIARMRGQMAGSLLFTAGLSLNRATLTSDPELLAEIQSLRTEVASLRGALDKTAANTGAQESFFRRISPDGNSIRTTAA